MKLLAMIAMTVGFLLTVTSCATHPTDTAINLNDGSKGILLVSVTSDKDKPGIDAWYYFRKKGDTEPVRLDASGFYFFEKPNDYPNDRTRAGRVFAFSLEPGEYELINWTLYFMVTANSYSYISPNVDPPPRSFSIAPGRITYIGNLHVHTLMGKNVFGMAIPAGGNPEITDRLEDDTDLILTKYPGLDDWPLDKSVPDARAWQLTP